MPKRTIRIGVFETNSSSTHSLTLGQLTRVQKNDDYQFETISVRPRPLAYRNESGDGIIAPLDHTNHFPGLAELCKKCEFLETKKQKHCQYLHINDDGSWEYRDYYEHSCTNPAYFVKIEGYNRKWSKYYDMCDKYKRAQIRAANRLVKEQNPDTRACALFTCIGCRSNDPEVCIKMYFDNLFKICKEVRYYDAPFNQVDNTVEFWKKVREEQNWGDYDSPCWMEEHGDLADDVVEIATDVTKLKQYLFGKGAYVGADRAG